MQITACHNLVIKRRVNVTVGLDVCRMAPTVLSHVQVVDAAFKLLAVANNDIPRIAGAHQTYICVSLLFQPTSPCHVSGRCRTQSTFDPQLGTVLRAIFTLKVHLHLMLFFIIHNAPYIQILAKSAIIHSYVASPSQSVQ
jgi:hypothetical protein